MSTISGRLNDAFKKTTKLRGPQVLSKKEMKLLGFITTFQEKHGEHPSFRQIKEKMGYESINSVSQSLNQLVDKGELFKVALGPRKSGYRLIKFQ